MYQYLILINPVGMMYGSAGGFLSPENLVGRSRAKFPPEAATLAGLIFSACQARADDERHKQLKASLSVAGPFWANRDSPSDFYVPMPWTKTIGRDENGNERWNEWYIEEGQWCKRKNSDDDREIEPEYQWLKLMAWNDPCDLIIDNEAAAKAPWEFVPILHPYMKDDERHVKDEDGLFLEYAVQVPDDVCLVYLSTVSLEPGWYRFGGENHIVEIESIDLERKNLTWILDPLTQPIQRAFASIAPGVWGSNRLSHRFPQHPDFPQNKIEMLTDKPVPFRYRAGKRMGRGRYAVPSGSVYVLDSPLKKPWLDWPDDWFPQEGFHLKRLGCGLCLPLKIEGVD